MNQHQNSGVQRVVEAAARKGVDLDIRVLAGPVQGVEEEAAAVGADQGQVVQSLVFVATRLNGRLAPIVCLISGRNRVEGGLLAAVIGETEVRRASAAEVRELTGYSMTSLPPFGLGRDVRVVMDQDLGTHEWLWAAAGSDSAMLRVTPGVLRMLSNAFVTPLAEAPWVASAMAQNAGPAMEGHLRFEAGSHA